MAQKSKPRMGVVGMEEVLLDLMDHMGLKDKTGLEAVRFLQVLCSLLMRHVFGWSLLVKGLGIFVD